MTSTANKARTVTELRFPQDKGGNLGKMKSATLHAISNMHGNVDKYRALQDTLDTLKEFAETRMRIQLEQRKQRVAASVAQQRVLDGSGAVISGDGAPDAAQSGTEASEPKPEKADGQDAKEPATNAPVAENLVNPNGNKSAV